MHDFGGGQSQFQALGCFISHINVAGLAYAHGFGLDAGEEEDLVVVVFDVAPSGQVAGAATAQAHANAVVVAEGLPPYSNTNPQKTQATATGIKNHENSLLRKLCTR